MHWMMNKQRTGQRQMDRDRRSGVFPSIHCICIYGEGHRFKQSDLSLIHTVRQFPNNTTAEPCSDGQCLCHDYLSIYARNKEVVVLLKYAYFILFYRKEGVPRAGYLVINIIREGKPMLSVCISDEIIIA